MILALLCLSLSFGPIGAAIRAQQQGSADPAAQPKEQDLKSGLKLEPETEDCSAKPDAVNRSLPLSTALPAFSFSRTASKAGVKLGSLEAKPAAPALNLSQLPGDRTRAGVADIYLMLEYRRDEMHYTGEPTNTFVFPEPVPPFSVPDSPIHFLPSAFEPNDEQLIGYVSARVKDYGFERLRFNTQVSFRYWGDLDGTSLASPFQNLKDAFRGRRVFEPLTAYTDIGGFMSDDRLSTFNVRVGRQFVYGAETVRLDGAAFSIDHARFELDLFGGRRVTFYSDPEERATFGGNFLFRATERTSFGYDVLHYVDTSHRFQFRHAIGESWIADGNFFLLDDSPIDLAGQAHYFSPDGNTRLTFSLLQKLSSDDFIYDFTYRDFARNPENQVRRILFPLPPTGVPSHGNERLSLFEINPYTQFYVDGYRSLSQKFGVGGTVWVRHVNDGDDRGPFDNSFQEFRASADYFASAAFEAGGEYRFRNLTREDPEQAESFDDIRREGETRFHELYATAAYHFPNSRFTLEGGLFYRRFSTQSRLISLDGVDTLGWTGAFKWRIARNYKLLLEYGRDDELAFINPDIDYTQSFRVRFEWRFNR
jgi:hypothetical protein